MKIKFFYNLLFLGLLAFVLQSRSGGMGAKMNQDRTGSPISQGNGSYCSACHSGSNFGPALSIKLYKNGNEVSEYTPGVAYELEVTVNSAQGSPTGYGMQAVVLDGSNSAAGTFGTPPSGTRLSNVGGIPSFEQGLISSANQFMIDWIAPAVGTGDVSIYAGGVAVNGDGGTSGDGAAKTTITLAEAASTGLDKVVQEDFKAIIASNPVHNSLQVELSSSSSGSMDIQLINSNGILILKHQKMLSVGETNVHLAVDHIQSGLYFVRLLHSNGSIQILKMLKA